MQCLPGINVYRWPTPDTAQWISLAYQWAQQVRLHTSSQVSYTSISIQMFEWWDQFLTLNLQTDWSYRHTQGECRSCLHALSWVICVGRRQNLTGLLFISVHTLGRNYIRVFKGVAKRAPLSRHNKSSSKRRMEWWNPASWTQPKDLQCPLTAIYLATLQNDHRCPLHSTRWQCFDYKQKNCKSPRQYRLQEGDRRTHLQEVWARQPCWAQFRTVQTTQHGIPEPHSPIKLQIHKITKLQNVRRIQFGLL